MNRSSTRLFRRAVNRASGGRRLAPTLAAGLLAIGLGAAGAAAETHSDLDDFGTKPGKSKAVTRNPASKLAPSLPPGAPPAKRLKAAPAKGPAQQKPRARGNRPPAGGFDVAGVHYASMAHYLFGVWRWRNPQGQVILFTFGRNGSFIFANTATGVRLFGSFRTQGQTAHFRIVRGCRGQDCRMLPQVQHRAYSFAPQSADVLTSANEVWKRISRN